MLVYRLNHYTNIFPAGNKLELVASKSEMPVYRLNHYTNIFSVENKLEFSSK